MLSPGWNSPERRAHRRQLVRALTMTLPFALPLELAKEDTNYHGVVGNVRCGAEIVNCKLTL